MGEATKGGETMRRLHIGVLAVAVGIFGAGQVFGVTSDPTCVSQARTQKKTCLSSCKDSYQQARDLCYHVDPSCVSGCRSDQATCAGPFLDTLQPCVDNCQSQLRTAKPACPPAGDPTRSDCIDAAQLTAFNCRDACRDDPTVSSGLQSCRQAFHSCVKGCPAAQ
jgi:hypothetical protein